jgi:hypothetical protein
MFWIFVSFIFPVFVQPSPGVRVSWDYRSRKIFSSFTMPSNPGYHINRLTYPRIIKFNSGDMMMFFQDGQWSWDIYSVRSTDNGITWSSPRIEKKSWHDTNDQVCYATPEVIQLNNGTVLLAYQRRNNKMKNETDGIEIMISHDEGKTWGSPLWVYRGMNWEPSFNQLASGEVQLFFTADFNGRTHVEMVRSLDNGLTWQPAPGSSYEAEYISASQSFSLAGDTIFSDGMPVGVELNGNKGVAIVIESLASNAIAEPHSPSIVWTSAANNWTYPDFHRNDIGPANRRWPVHNEFQGYSPYLIKLSTGEIIVQSNGTFKGQEGMFAFIGDKEARNFGAVSMPYSDVPGWWGCIKYLGDDLLISAANYEIGANPNGLDALKNIVLTKGQLLHPMGVFQSTPLVDGIKEASWSQTKPWFIGRKSQAQGLLSMSHDDNSLYMLWESKDEKINTDSDNKTDDDGFVLYLNSVNTSSNSLVNGVYKITITAAENIFIERYNNGSWQTISNIGAITKTTINGTINNNNDMDAGYVSESSVPWSLIGGMPSLLQPINAHLVLLNDDDGGALDIADEMEGNVFSDPSSWFAVNLTGLRQEKNYWHFTSSMEGWTPINQMTATASNSIATATITGADPFMHSPDNLNFSATDYKYVVVSMQNQTASTTAELFWITTAETGFEATKMVEFPIVANDIKQRYYIIDLSAKATWTGTIKQLRLDPTTIVTSGTVKIDFIKFVGSYQSALTAIPGTLEAEDFNKGGQNNAYNDFTTANEGGAYRLDESVDIQSIPGGGYSLGWLNTGEWLEYTVNVAEGGEYLLEVIGSSVLGKDSLEVSAIINGSEISVGFEATGGLHNYVSQSVLLQLQAGVQLIRVEITQSAGGFNLDKILFSKYDTPVTIPLKPKSPLPQKMHSKIYDLKGRRL